ncbi:hypothetical protein Ddc_18589 [Ditylenchus destructor]|nr:hypothetical protein Ddc_18589 [Ditylenchus destructor]
MRDTCSCGALLLFGVASGAQQIAALGGGDFGLIEGFVIKGPAGCCQLGACLGYEDGFAGLLRGGVITPVEQPRNELCAADGHGHDGRQQHEGNERIDHPCSPTPSPKRTRQRPWGAGGGVE